MEDPHAAQSQLDELNSIRGLIEDATRDAILWLQANPSAEAQAHVLAMQGRLGDLDRIITRRMGRRDSPEDARQWSQTVVEVLTLLDKAREVTGNIVGNGLARIAARLPKELPGTKPPKRPHVRVPPPVKPVNTSGSLRLPPEPAASVGGKGTTPVDVSSRKPESTQVPDLPSYYPNDLKSQTRLILIEAVRKFPDQTRTPELCKYIFSELTSHVRAAVLRGTLRADLALFDMEALLHSVLAYNDPGPSSGWGLSNEAYRLEQEVKKSDEWLGLAKAIDSARLEREAVAGAADRLRTDASQAESSRAQNNANAARSVESKSASAPANAEAAESKPADRRAEQDKAVAPKKGSVGGNWFDSDTDTLRRRQIVLKNPRMSSKSLCKVFDTATPPIPLPRDWQAELNVNTWSEAYKNKIGRKRIQKIISTDRKAV